MLSIHESSLRSATLLPSLFSLSHIRPIPEKADGIRIKSVHSATLGKGQSDDTLVRIKQGELGEKGEIAMVFGKQVCTRSKTLIKSRSDANFIGHTRRPSREDID